MFEDLLVFKIRFKRVYKLYFFLFGFSSAQSAKRKFADLSMIGSLEL